MKKFAVGAIALISMVGSAFAGELTISDAKIRATPKGAKVSAGYVVIRNNSDAADRLLGASSSFAQKTEVHEMKMENNVMKMRPLKDGISIPAAAEVILKPGAEHLMFMKLTETMTPGDKKMVTLKFEIAGEMQVEFEVVEQK